MFCSKCGTNIPDGFLFCTNCGAAVVMDNAPASAAENVAQVSQATQEAAETANQQAQNLFVPPVVPVRPVQQSYEAQQPVYETQQPVYQAQQPTYQTQQPVYETPQPTYQAQAAKAQKPKKEKVKKEKAQKPPKQAAVPREPKEKTSRKKWWLIPLILLLLLGVGAAAYFFLLKDMLKPAVNLNDYVAVTLENNNGSYVARPGFAVDKLVDAQRDKLQVTEEAKTAMREYLKEMFPDVKTTKAFNAMRDAYRDAYKQRHGKARSEEDALLDLFLLAALADDQNPGGQYSLTNPQAEPLLRRGVMEPEEGLQPGDAVVFKWSAIDSEAVEKLFGLKVKTEDIQYSLSADVPPASTETAAPSSPVATETTVAPTQPAVPETTTVEATTGPDTTTTAEMTTAPTTTAPTTTAPTTTVPTTTARPEITVKKGDILTFGRYEQDNTESNGQEDIEWVVFAFNDKYVYLLSRYILDVQPFQPQQTSVTYDSSYIRGWLNQDFINTAFTGEEAKLMVTMTAEFPHNYDYPKTAQGKDVRDKVALMSIEEIKEYFSTNDSRLCMGTRYAFSKGLFRGDSGYCPWWTRTMGSNSQMGTIVRSDGIFNSEGWAVNEDWIGIRPCICLEWDTVYDCMAGLDPTASLQPLSPVYVLQAQ